MIINTLAAIKGAAKGPMFMRWVGGRCVTLDIIGGWEVTLDSIEVVTDRIAGRNSRGSSLYFVIVVVRRLFKRALTYSNP